MPCIYEQDYAGCPKCAIFPYKKFKNVENFLINKFQSDEYKSLALLLDCFGFDRANLVAQINSSKCISCNACLMLCPGSAIQIEENNLPSFLCSDFTKISQNSIQNISEKYIKFGGFNSNLKKFDVFTSSNETEHISVWGAVALKYILGKESRVSLEVPLSLSGRARDGRLDICCDDNGTLIIAEAKISLKKLMEEGRYSSQILGYKEELSDIYKKHGLTDAAKIFLLVGGNENDLLPYTHDDCTSIAGNISINFYKEIIKYGIKFVSAKALMSIAMSKYINPADNIKERFIKSLADKDVLGIVSDRLVVLSGDSYKLSKI